MSRESVTHASFALSPRDSHENHRMATPLELFFAIASVAAIAVLRGR